MYPHNTSRPRAGERRAVRENVVFITDEPQRVVVVSGRRRRWLFAVVFALAGIGVNTLWSLLLATIELAF